MPAAAASTGSALFSCRYPPHTSKASRFVTWSIELGAYSAFISSRARRQYDLWFTFVSVFMCFSSRTSTGSRQKSTSLSRLPIIPSWWASTPVSRQKAGDGTPPPPPPCGSHMVSSRLRKICKNVEKQSDRQLDLNHILWECKRSFCPVKSYISTKRLCWPLYNSQLSQITYKWINSCNCP